MDRRDYLKPSRFGNIEKRRILEKKNLNEKRSTRRTTNFNLRRDIEDIAQEIKENTPITKYVPKKDPILDRKLALQKFRAEKEMKKQALNDRKKPPFIVGIPHHGSSPILKTLSAENNCKKGTKTTSTQEVRSKRVTRATTRTVKGIILREKPKMIELPRNGLHFNAPSSIKVFPFKANKTVFSFQPLNIHQSAKKLTSPQTPTVLKRSVQKKQLKAVSNVIKGRKSPRNNYNDEELAAPLAIDTTQKEEAVGGTQAPNERNEMPENQSPQLNNETGHLPVEEKEDEGVTEKDENQEISEQVAFQHNRLQTETNRLQELADQWQEVVSCESLPQEVVDEVDSVVGQTRLLTSDKFQQFRRLIVQFENKTGTHPVTLDDLNGFWDMVFLQVESLDKKYTTLNILKNNNWVYPEPATKKKRRPVKKLAVNKVTEIENPTTSDKTKKHNLLQLPEDQQIQTPSTDRKSLISGVLLSRKRTRSNSPSPYIAMRLSAVGRKSNIVAISPRTDGTPRSVLVNTTDTHGRPKSARKQTSTVSTMSSSGIKIEEDVGEIKIEEAVEEIKSEEAVEETYNLNGAEEPVPAVTPRRSIRLMTNYISPSPCSICNLANSVECKSMENSASKRTRRSKKMLAFSPSESQCKVESKTMADVNKTSTSGVRFSLRPSILTVIENSNFCEIPKKTKKRRQASVLSGSTTTEDLVAEEPTTAESRRSTRQSRRVTFVSGAEEKFSFKLPATPYRRSQADS